jgi:RimJ/RimL family protein N-acetyltransferase
MKRNIPELNLRPTNISDLDTLFHFQLDEEGRYLAAFIPKDPSNKEAYLKKYTKLLNDPSVKNKTILIGSQIVGSIGMFMMNGEMEITYWIDKAFWGKGIATSALRQFLSLESVRPVFARVVFDNYGSQSVLEKCGFIRVGSDKGFANARHAVVEEFIYKLG